MNGRPLTIPHRMSPLVASRARRIAEDRLHTGREAIARSARLLAGHHLGEVRGIVSRAAPRRP